ncbi:MAG: M48 family metalloprotease [Bacteroidaceae bacterium]|nr:M48 family metalloprotease [Bacteroidaceae bacterium]
MARRLDPTIKVQEILRNQLEGALQGEVLTAVRRATQGAQFEFQQRTEMAANALKITKATMENLYNICMEVKESLEYKEDIDFYIMGDNSVNAYSYITEDFDMPHIIVINSGLFNLMDENELRFVLGHEIGHLVNKDSYVSRLYSFIYKVGGEDNAPEILKSRMDQYNQLAEYAADRYGFQGCMDLGACITALYKLTCGIDLYKMGVSIDSLIEQNYQNTGFLLDLGVVEHSDHPDIPLRISALIAYATSPTIKGLEEEMNVVFRAIPGVLKTEDDYNLALFSAAAGIKLAGHDGKIDKTEKDIIIEEIAKYELEPSKFLKQVLKNDVDAIYDQSLKYILKNEPERVGDVLDFFIELAFADKEMKKEELEAIMKLGRKLKLDDNYIYNAIAMFLRENYSSIADSL